MQKKIINKSLSPNSLPKLSVLKNWKGPQDTALVSALFKSNSEQQFFQELEKKLIQQKQEIINRDSEVKTVIYNLENIIESHNIEKMKNIELNSKYLRTKKQLEDLKENFKATNEKLINSENYSKIELLDFMKSEIETLKSNLEKKEKELIDKKSLIFSLEIQKESLQKEIAKVFELTGREGKNEKPRFTNPDLKPHINKNIELENDIKRLQESLKVAKDQITNLKESETTLQLENSILRFKLNNGTSSSPKEETTEPAQSTFRSPSEDSTIVQKLTQPDSSLNLLIEEKLTYLKEIEKLNDNLLKFKESEILKTEQLKKTEKELKHFVDISESYKKKSADLSIELKSVNEAILIKDERIKRDAEIIKYLKSTDPESSASKKNLKELEETCKQLGSKSEKILEISKKEKEEWAIKEKSYCETINNLISQVNSSKNKGENQSSEFENVNYEIEAKILKRELDETKEKNENLNEKNAQLTARLDHFGFLLRQVEDILKCCNCFSSEKDLSLNLPCLHFLCETCRVNKCKECYSSIKKSVKPKFVESLVYVVNQVKMFARSN